MLTCCGGCTDSMGERLCLRCEGVPLVRTEPIFDDVSFFECPTCGRRYTLRAGKGLTFRWLHPISLALYLIIPDPLPSARAAEIATRLKKELPLKILKLLVQEVRLELETPTQQLRDIVDCRATEEDYEQV